MSALTKGAKLLVAHRTAETYSKTARDPTGARVSTGFVSGDVEVWVDASAIFARLAAKALRNTSGKASAMQGAVVVIARNKTKRGATTSNT